MDPLDILYTPLDTIQVPNYDVNKLVNWISKNQYQYVSDRRDASLKTPREKYPWGIAYPKFQKMWNSYFDKLFPELAHYFSAAFQLEDKDINAVVLLPIRSDFIGQGFWHRDPDTTGLRIYLENTEHDKDFLLIKSTKLPINKPDTSIAIPNDGDDERYNSHIYSAKIYKSRQVFFLNNVRAIHSANVTTLGAFRIAVIVTINKEFDTMPQHIKNLIVNSAQKFSDLAVIRT